MRGLGERTGAGDGDIEITKVIRAGNNLDATACVISISLVQVLDLQREERETERTQGKESDEKNHVARV